MVKYVIPFLIAFLVTYIMTPIIRHYAMRKGVFDVPDARKVHTGNIPRLGGIAIFIGYIIAVLYSLPFTQEVIALLIGTIVLTMVGIWDDIKPLEAKTKLVGQILAASVLVMGGVDIDWITLPWGGIWYFPPWMAAGITIFWIVSFINMVNLIDGLDGLAAGISLISAMTIFCVSLAMGQVETAVLTLCLAGATFAFLKYNFNPAKIFMGDTGSMLLGYTLGAISVIGVVKTAATVSLVVPVIVLGIPIMDTAFAILRRYMNGSPIFKPDKGHLHHRLLAKGFTQKQAVLLMYAVTLVFGVISLLVVYIQPLWGAILLGVVLAFAIYVAKCLDVIGKNIAE